MTIFIPKTKSKEVYCGTGDFTEKQANKICAWLKENWYIDVRWKENTINYKEFYSKDEIEEERKVEQVDAFITGYSASTNTKGSRYYWWWFWIGMGTYRLLEYLQIF